MNNPVQTIFRWVIDIALALGLITAAGVIYGLDKKVEGEPDPPRGEEVVVKVEKKEVPRPKPVPKPLAMALTPPQYDDMGKLLTTMGKGYDNFDTLTLEDLGEGDKLKKYDVLFLTCRNNPPRIAKVKQALREYVAGGGTLYASDLWYGLIADTFLEYAATTYPVAGKKQEVSAQVADPGLREVLGTELHLNFEVAGWVPASFAGEKVTTLLKGRYEPVKGDPMDVPLLVKFPHEKGTVIFTSFHNAQQNDESEKKLLRYLVFIAATAQEEAKVFETIAEGGFSPKKQNLLTASSGDPSVTASYQSTKGSRIKFVLGFANRGARLRLTVVSPTGQKTEKEGIETFSQEIDNAPVGEWKYTVTALEVPFPNFPFKVTIGE